MSDNLYLKQNIVAEPLFNQWYAWPYLIPPASAAMYIANWHLKIMNSFVSAPQVHVAALKNPAMLGGPFVNYDPSRVKEVKELINRTVDEQAPMLEFAAAFKTVDDFLQKEADGHSLEPLYQKVPPILRGYIELVYDLHNRPSIRLIEGLLYKSPYYHRRSQSIALFADLGEQRRFALSSPQLLNGEQVHLRVPFDDERLDQLFKAKFEPQPFETLKDLLQVDKVDAERFRSFFTSETPHKMPEKFNADGVRVRYFGHACILIETKRVSILTDPLISYHSDADSQRYTYADLPPQIDYALITHGHQDHFMFETLLQLRHKIKNVIVPRSTGSSIADPSLRLILKAIGFDRVQEIDETEALEIPGGQIIGIPFLGEHGDLNIKAKIAYLIKLEGWSALCAADSNNLQPELYNFIRDCVGAVDLVFLGMECDGAPLSWLYGPLMTKPLARKMDQSRRFDGSDCNKALKLVGELNPKQVYVYAMGQEPWLTFLTSIQYTDTSRPIVESDRLVETCRRDGIMAERLFRQKEITLNR
jgi:L-ascorbate metabolism protein UlaG (beta-lactamase superfamily)